MSDPKRRQRAKRALAEERGKRRREHFTHNGDPAQWRERRTVHRDRKKAANRRACRGRVQSQD